MNTPDYKEFQICKVLFVLMAPIQFLGAYLIIGESGISPDTFNRFLVYNSVFILIYLMFYGMTTIISEDRITVLYGIGLIRKRIHINKIVSVQSVENPWYHGLGMRIIPNGILYSIDGKHAVELKFKNTNKVVRIGTNNSTQLKRKITKRMKLS